MSPASLQTPATRHVEVTTADYARALNSQSRQQEQYATMATGIVAGLEAAGFQIQRLRELRRPGALGPLIHEHRRLSSRTDICARRTRAAICTTLGSSPTTT